MVVVSSLKTRCFVGRASVAWVLLALPLALGTDCLRGASVQTPERVDFNFQIRPLLSDRCFKCHGPDEKSRKAKLRLDVAEVAYALRDAETGKRAISPGRPLESEVYRRITASDPDDIMPPPKSGLSLRTEDKELIRRWIEQGAEYKAHWSFIPVQAQAVPHPAEQSQVRNAIDAFVVTRLEPEGLKPAPEAPRETLIRRLSFDLTGLPPALEEIDSFVHDSSADAYEKLVDRLLASPAYGERCATDWLDLARYADTYGYQNDFERDMSPWRDWVIRAFNQNLPYDEFITWQLAGDLLPAPTQDQILATTFNRLHRQTNEGGSIDEEFRTEYAADRVQTTGTAFLGLTIQCARCHDHKFDPISQRDYYRFFAFFNNIDESGLYAHFTMATPSPTLLLYPERVEAKHQVLKRKIVTAEARLATLAETTRPAFEEWLTSGDCQVTPPEPSAAYSFELVHENTTPNAIGTNTALLVDGPTQVPGRHGQALRFSGDNSLVCQGAGAFARTSAFTFSLWLWPAERQERAVVFHRSRVWTDSGSRGYELVLEDGKPSFALVHFWPGNAIKVRVPPLATNRWTHLAVTYDGSSRAQGIRIYLDGVPAPLEVVRDGLFKDILHRKEWGDADVGNIELTLAGRFRDSGFRNGLIDEFNVFDRCLTPPEVYQLSDAPGVNDDPASLFEYYLARIDEDYPGALSELRQMRSAENDLVNDVPEIMVMHELPQRRATYVLKRGAYDAPGEPVEPGPPERILPFADDLPRDRLGLARWIVDQRNPLTARVAVNRVWRSHFGRGLVATPEDFGSQGQLPTHPELLDWLAWRFMDGGWNLKALHKLIVMSATYRQSSTVAPELLARDPDNRLLARGPKHRLEAEQIRDNALAVSGLLSQHIGGPSVRPSQPSGLWEESGTGKTYVQDKGERLYRRSLYTFWKRTAPPPNMLSFDATSREVCTARRETTSTPLQSLVLLNDPQFLEAARVLAENLVRETAHDVDARILRAFRLATGREPSARESEVLRQLYTEQLARFTKERGAAEAFIRIGEYPLDEALPVQEVAATTLLTSTLMNLDEFVMQR
jgi:Protein of unknown function (DUF1553)/Protein of unknown function (DUF1549)/Concanavalin A-like lectin/glucanases superfamily/Planctomycete cytochrome C